MTMERLRAAQYLHEYIQWQISLSVAKASGSRILWDAPDIYAVIDAILEAVKAEQAQEQTDVD